MYETVFIDPFLCSQCYNNSNNNDILYSSQQEIKEL